MNPESINNHSPKAKPGIRGVNTKSALGNFFRGLMLITMLSPQACYLMHENDPYDNDPSGYAPDTSTNPDGEKSDSDTFYEDDTDTYQDPEGCDGIDTGYEGCDGIDTGYEGYDAGVIISNYEMNDECERLGDIEQTEKDGQSYIYTRYSCPTDDAMDEPCHVGEKGYPEGCDGGPSDIIFHCPSSKNLCEESGTSSKGDVINTHYTCSDRYEDLEDQCYIVDESEGSEYEYICPNE